MEVLVPNFMDDRDQTKSMQIAREDLALDDLTVVYPGDIEYPLTKEIHVRPLKSF